MASPLDIEREKVHMYGAVGKEALSIAKTAGDKNPNVGVERQHAFRMLGAQFVLVPEDRVYFPKAVWIAHHHQKSWWQYRQELNAVLGSSGAEFGELVEALQRAEATQPRKEDRGFWARLFLPTPRVWPELADFIAASARFSISANTRALQFLVNEWNFARPVPLSQVFSDEPTTGLAQTTIKELLHKQLQLGKKTETVLFDLTNAKVLARLQKVDDIKTQTQDFIRGQFDSIQRNRASTIIYSMKPEKLREATTGKINQISSLEKFGYKTVGDVFDAKLSSLIAIPMIGEQTASRMKAAAQTLYNEEINTNDFHLGSTPNLPAKRVVLALKRYAEHQTKIEKVANARQELKPFFDAVNNVPNGVKVLLSASTKWDVSELKRLLIQFAELSASQSAEDGYSARDIDDAWEDYLKRPAHYQAILGELLGTETIDAGLEFLDKNTIEAIRKFRLDTSLMRDIFVRGYQQFAAKFVVVQGKMLLGDEMGLGKTLQAISAAAHVSAAKKQRRKKARVLVIVPASLLLNWDREINKFSKLKTFIAHGKERQSIAESWNLEGGMLITTYDSLKTLELATPLMVIVDEAHMIKNPEAQRSQAVKEQLEKADYAMLMTGTPIENRLDEFVNLVTYLAPGLQTSLETITSPRIFKKEIAPFYLRRNQKDVLDELPEKNETIDWVELTPDDETFYRNAIAEGAWMSARRAAYSVGKKSAKVGRILELVAEAKAEGKNIIIFSYFLDVLNLLTQAIGSDCVGAITGGVTAKDRQKYVDVLGKRGHVLLAQISAGGVGLNIQHASVVILTEVQVKPSIEDQAIARAHRMGQINVVNVHRIVGKNTIDERLLEITGEKRQLFDEFARDSNSAKIYDAKDITEIKIAQEIIAQERERLDIDSTKEVVIDSPKPDTRTQ